MGRLIKRVLPVVVLAAVGGLIWLTVGAPAVVGPAGQAERSGANAPGAEGGTTASAAKDEAAVDWRTDLMKALRVAKKQEKRVVVDFYADWCGPCKQMARTTFQAASVRRALEAFVPVKINVDEHRELAAKYDVKALPTSLVLAPSGRTVSREVGYLGSDDYVRFLESAGGDSATTGKGE